MFHVEYFSRVPNSQEIFSEIDHVMQGVPTGGTSKEDLLRAYDKLVESEGLCKFTEELLGQISRDDAFAPLWISGTECPIIANTASVLSLRCFALGNEIDAIYAAPGDLVLTLLSEEPISVEIYMPSADYSKQTLVEERRLSRKTSLRLSNGQAFRLNGNSRPALLSRLLLGLVDFTPVYDSKTLEFLSMLSLNPSNSRWAFMAQVAPLLNPKAAVSILEKLTTHGDYDVRWKALQGLFQHDTAGAMRILESFQRDPSEFISTQAQQEFERISQLAMEG